MKCCIYFKITRLPQSCTWRPLGRLFLSLPILTHTTARSSSLQVNDIRAVVGFCNNHIEGRLLTRQVSKRWVSRNSNSSFAQICFLWRKTSIRRIFFFKSATPKCIKGFIIGSRNLTVELTPLLPVHILDSHKK